ncbi:MAG: beta-lactamase family protein [Kangiellaceae bacterium]|nr:beta-lactamase family protein [Kangiellaceae bacterium]MCW8998430.1 beta-lactamase family protein [Kangiellaceae bacterium]
MKNFKKTLFSLSLGLVSLTSTSFAFAIEKESASKLDQFFEVLEKNNKAMLSVALSKDGEIVYQKQIGKFNVSKNLNSNQDTKYRVGSITKIFAATVVMQLIEEGKLSLDTKLSKFFPQVKNAENITVEHLLGHRSGIYNFTNEAGYFSYMTKKRTREQMLKIISDFSSDFEPGSKYAYSNSNYVLLGYIIEDVTKSSFADALNHRIVRKLGLKNTQYGAKIGTTQNEAYSYRFQSGSWVKAEETDMSIPHAAGAVVSTPTDLTIFMHGLFSGKLVSNDSLASMKKIKDGYGKGLITFPFGQKQAFGHGGGIDGFVSNTAYFPEDGLALAATSNGLNYEFNNMMIAILSAYYNVPFEIPNFDLKPIQLSVDKMKKLEGIYQTSSLPMDITVKLDGDNLTAQASGQSPFPLTSYSETEFRFDAAGIVMVFVDGTGKPSFDNFVLKQGGGKHLFSRK